MDGLLSLDDSSLGRISDFVLHILHGLFRRAVLATAVLEDTSDLDSTDTTQEEVNGSEPRIMTISGAILCAETRNSADRTGSSWA